MVFQNYALFPHMTVGKNLAFPLKVRGKSQQEIDAGVVKALEMVQMVDFIDRYPAQLSGGQKQRVALARALVFEPELVLMDEPLGALDKQLREQMQYEIKNIHEQLGVTVVYVTHDQSEALTMSDRIAVFEDGIIQQIAPPDDLYERPENSFVAQFIGENNTLLGTVEAIHEDGTADVLLESGEKVKALAVNVDAQGDKTRLSIRPERVVINPGKEEIPLTIEGEVKQLIYLGDHIRCRMSAGGNDEFIVKIPNASDEISLAVGDRIQVGWQTRDCRALDAD
jgi:putative spermidine/putrescine transport system ATP-binding protein